MGDLWVLTAWIPLVCLAVAALMSRPLGKQHALTTASTPERFRAIVGISGGRAAVLRGLAYDLLFIVSFGPFAAIMLYRADGLWVLPIVAIALDALEDLLVLRLLDSSLSTPSLRRLNVIAYLKLAAYLASVVAIGAAAVT